MWKEIKEGRVLLPRDDDSPEMQTVVFSSWSRVPKQNTDPTISDEGRFCHDLRDAVKTYIPEDSLPNVVLNTHKEAARATERFAARYLGIPQKLAKRDVKLAFKLLWLHPGETETTATDLLGDVAGFSEALVAVYLVLTFGWKAPQRLAVLGRGDPMHTPRWGPTSHWWTVPEPSSLSLWRTTRPCFKSTWVPT